MTNAINQSHTLCSCPAPDIRISSAPYDPARYSAIMSLIAWLLSFPITSSCTAFASFHVEEPDSWIGMIG